jgi:arylsulfatase A-like enzyme
MHKLIISFFLLFALTHGTFSQTGGQKPNVLLIMIDDLNDWTGFLGGHPNAVTPNMDELASKSISFLNAHCPAPICNPSRTAILSGVAPYVSGVYQNGDVWNKSEPLKNIKNLPLHFRENGYYTMMGGKIFHSQPPDIKNAFDEMEGRMGGQNFDLMSPDFTYPFSGYYGVHNFALHWGPLDSTDAETLSDNKIEAWAKDKLNQRYDKPFFLAVGFHRPHEPLTAPRKYFELFKDDEVELPLINENDLDDIPNMGKQIAVAGYQELQGGFYKQISERGLLKTIVKSYLASTTYVDAKIGNVLEALDKTPYRDNTIIILASDNGWSLGEQTHFKKWSIWEATTRVPFIIYVPGMRSNGKASTASVNLLDLYPTLVDLCKLPTPKHTLDGQSLLPLLRNPDKKREQPSITTYGQNVHAIRDEQWRYIQYSDGTEELYDHMNDPNEWKNLATLPEHRKTKTALAKWLPKTNIMAVQTDHNFPVRLTPKEYAKEFVAITTKLVNRPIHIKASIGPEFSNGVILSHGSQFAGYSLYIKNGFLNFAIMDVPSPLRWDNLFPSRTIVTSTKKLPIKKLEVEAILAADGAIGLWVDGEHIGSGEAKTLSIHPAGRMLLGQSSVSTVPIGDYTPPFRFQGIINEVIVDNAIKLSIK